MHKHATIGDTVYFWFASNDTSGSGGDGATPLFDVREAGAAADAVPLLSGTPTLLSHANYPAGCYEVAVAATAGNGFADGDEFAVFCTLAIDSQNPTGFVGSCSLSPIVSDVKKIAGVTAPATNLSLSAGTIIPGTVSYNNTVATTTVFYSDDITEATTGHYNGRIIIFTSGALQNQATDITGYSLVSGEGKFTVTALTEAPANNVTFVIV